MITSKKCSKCGEIKDLSLFSKGKDTKLGYKSACKQCLSTSFKNYCLTDSCKMSRNKFNNKLHSSRRQWLNEIKLEKGCELCGYNKHPAALQFDHIEPALKSFTISQDLKKPMHILLEELDKCRVLCANCHAEESMRQKHYLNKKYKIL